MTVRDGPESATHAHDHRLEKAVEAAEHLLGRDFDEIPRSDRALDGFEQRALHSYLAALTRGAGALQVRRVLQVVQPGRPLHACLGSRAVLAIQLHLGVPLVREDLARWLVLVVRPYPAAQEGLRRSNLSGSNFLGTAPPAPQLSNRR
jgi:hypothetical protein